MLTAQALLCYTVGLWAFSTIRVIVAAFYSLQDTKTPVRIAVVALIVNTVFSVALMFPLKHSGLALATSIASAVNVLTLGFLLRKRIGGFLDADFWRSVARVTAASIVMWIAVALTTHTLGWDVAAPFRHRFTVLAAGLAVGIVRLHGLRLRPAVPRDDDASLHDPPQARPPLALPPAFRDKMIDVNVAEVIREIDFLDVFSPFSLPLP